MRIAFASGSLTSLVNFRGPLLRCLEEQGHTVSAIAPPEALAENKLRGMNIEFVPVNIGRTGLNPGADLKTIYQFWRQIKKSQPDLFFASQIKAVTYGLLAATLAGVPKRAVMIEGLGAAFANASGWQRKLAKWVSLLLYFCTLRFAHVVFFLNREDKAYFERRPFWGRGTKAVLLPGIGIDLVHFATIAIPQPPITFLMVARLHKDKGGGIYAAAAERLRGEFPDARFQMLGPQESGLGRVTMEELKLWQKKGVEYLGETEDVRPFLAACHVVVLPTSYREGLPRSLLEGMATGRPLLTTNMPGARETVVADKNGILVEPNDVNDLVKAMRWYLEHSEELERMGRQSRIMAEDRFAVSYVNQLIVTALDLP